MPDVREGQLPRPEISLHVLPRAHSKVGQRRRTIHGSANQVDAALTAAQPRTRVKMRCREGVPDFKMTVRQLPAPTSLQEVEMVDLTQSGETGGAGKRWAHSPSNQSFLAYGFAPIRQ